MSKFRSEDILNDILLRFIANVTSCFRFRVEAFGLWTSSSQRFHDDMTAFGFCYTRRKKTHQEKIQAPKVLHPTLM